MMIVSVNSVADNTKLPGCFLAVRL